MDIGDSRKNSRWGMLLAVAIGGVGCCAFLAVRATWTLTLAMPTGLARDLLGSALEFQVSQLGAVWFCTVLGLVAGAVASRRAEYVANLPAYLFILCVPALGFAYSMSLRVSFDAWTTPWVASLFLLCTTIVVFIVSVSSPMPSLRGFAGGLAADLKALGRSPVGWVAGGALMLMTATLVPPRETGPAAATSLEAWYASQPRVEGAPFTIPGAVSVVAFVDYQCPPCKMAHDGYRPVFEEFQRLHPDVLRLATRHFPLDSRCNPGVHAQPHPLACEAAATVVLAEVQGRGLAMEEWLFEHQARLSPQRLVRAAREVGGIGNLDGLRAEGLLRVRQDIEVALRHGVSSTPTYYVQGVRVGTLSPQHLRRVLEHAVTGVGRRVASR